MDTDRENDFWREGRTRSLYKSERSRNSDYQIIPIFSINYEANQSANSRRRSVRKIEYLIGNETSTDDEYFALYKTQSNRGNRTDKSNGTNFCNSSAGDCVVEPIETILSRTLYSLTLKMFSQFAIIFSVCITNIVFFDRQRDWKIFQAFDRAIA